MKNESNSVRSLNDIENLIQSAESTGDEFDSNTSFEVNSSEKVENLNEECLLLNAKNLELNNDIEKLRIDNDLLLSQNTEKDTEINKLKYDLEEVCKNGHDGQSCFSLKMLKDAELQIENLQQENFDLKNEKNKSFGFFKKIIELAESGKTTKNDKDFAEIIQNIIDFTKNPENNKKNVEVYRNTLEKVDFEEIQRLNEEINLLTKANSQSANEILILKTENEVLYKKNIKLEEKLQTATNELEKSTVHAEVLKLTNTNIKEKYKAKQTKLKNSLKLEISKNSKIEETQPINITQLSDEIIEKELQRYKDFEKKLTEAEDFLENKLNDSENFSSLQTTLFYDLSELRKHQITNYIILYTKQIANLEKRLIIQDKNFNQEINSFYSLYKTEIDKKLEYSIQAMLMAQKIKNLSGKLENFEKQKDAKKSFLGQERDSKQFELLRSETNPVSKIKKLIKGGSSFFDKVGPSIKESTFVKSLINKISQQKLEKN